MGDVGVMQRRYYSNKNIRNNKASKNTIKIISQQRQGHSYGQYKSKARARLSRDNASKVRARLSRERQEQGYAEATKIDCSDTMLK
ncbi:hypothetical protein PRUPE_3G194300 [Prunus persica]|uniref:Uncharacterized protein n=1 Tax=Prunus persica TaxID=3760 RepID=A0A251Q2U1_PRUPE|nr:hypothetical protein PRUPE_3G194300 [Prunus persica]